MGNDEDRVRVPARIGNWLLDQNLGSGYSGSIWRATNPFTNQVAAIKVQDVDHECPTNRYERNFYPSLQGGIGMPTLWAAGVQGDFDYLVIDLLGPSLDNLYRKNGRKMDLRSTICIAMQVITRLEFMHSRGILHRDIQLGNCVVGLGKTESTIYMIDFGFSKRYIDPHTRKHIPDSKAKRDFIENYWFSSVNVHCRGKVPSRRDDMEALALMLIHLITDGGLPWTRNGVPKNDKQHDVIIRRKLNAKPDELCRGLPPVFEEFLRYCRRLKFLDQPNYRWWREQFEELAREKGFVEADGSVSDALVWPPKVEEIPRVTPQRARAAQQGIETILAEIANMRLESRRKGDAPKPAVTELAEGVRGSKPPLKEKACRQDPAAAPDARNAQNAAPGAAKQSAQTDVIVISSEDESEPSSRRLGRSTKQATMRQLEQQVYAALDNGELARLVRQFTDTFQTNRSKVVTKEAFDFLNALCKQLDDPSIIIVADSKAAGGVRVLAETNGPQSRLRQRSAQLPKAETVKTLRLKLQSEPPIQGNAQFAKIITEFSAAIRATSGKTLTRDGVVFLEELATRLEK